MQQINRIALVGSGGAGKSTLARQLGTRLNLPVYHLDALYWKPGWQETPRPEWLALQQELVSRERWIIDGNYSNTLQTRIDAADLVVFMDFPRLVCLWGVLKRRFMYAGRTRPDMGEGCPEKVDLEFVRWVWNFPKRGRVVIEQRLAQVAGQKQVVRLRSRREVQAFLDGFRG